MGGDCSGQRREFSSRSQRVYSARRRMHGWSVARWRTGAGDGDSFMPDPQAHSAGCGPASARAMQAWTGLWWTGAGARMQVPGSPHLGRRVLRAPSFAAPALRSPTAAWPPQHCAVPAAAAAAAATTAECGGRGGLLFSAASPGQPIDDAPGDTRQTLPRRRGKQEARPQSAGRPCAGHNCR